MTSPYSAALFIDRCAWAARLSADLRSAIGLHRLADAADECVGDPLVVARAPPPLPLVKAEAVVVAQLNELREGADESLLRDVLRRDVVFAETGDHRGLYLRQRSAVHLSDEVLA